MKKQHFTLLSALLTLLMMGSQIHAQTYQVSTLTPASAQVANDALTLDDAGNLYGSFYGYPGAAGNRIMRIRPNGSYDTLITGLTNPNGINYRDGKLFFSNAYSQLRESDTLGNDQVVTSIPGFVNVIPLPNSDSLIGVSYGQNRVYGIGTNGNTVISNDPLLDGPAGLAFDHDGILYVGNFNNGKVLKYNGNGGFTVLDDLGGGLGFIAYGDSAIFATNYGDNKVYRIPTNGGATTVIAGSGQAATIDGAGTAAAFNFPNGIISTFSGDTIYISEYQSSAIRVLVRNPATGNVEPKNTISPTVFPVPGPGIFRIRNLDWSQVLTSQVFNMNGQLVHVQESTSLTSDQSLDLSELAPGMYQLVLQGIGKEVLLSTKIQISR